MPAPRGPEARGPTCRACHLIHPWGGRAGATGACGLGHRRARHPWTSCLPGPGHCSQRVPAKGLSFGSVSCLWCLDNWLTPGGLRQCSWCTPAVVASTTVATAVHASAFLARSRGHFPPRRQCGNLFSFHLDLIVFSGNLLLDPRAPSLRPFPLVSALGVTSTGTKAMEHGQRYLSVAFANARTPPRGGARQGDVDGGWADHALEAPWAPAESCHGWQRHRFGSRRLEPTCAHRRMHDHCRTFSRS